MAAADGGRIVEHHLLQPLVPVVTDFDREIEMEEPGSHVFALRLEVAGLGSAGLGSTGGYELR